MTDVAPVSVLGAIGARPQTVFTILVDPSRHVEIDGSGMLRGAIDAAPVSGLVRPRSSESSRRTAPSGSAR